METKKRQKWVVISGCLIGLTCLGLIVIVGVYGRILTPTIDYLTITWGNGWSADVTPIENGYLFFQAWSPVDGSAEPVEITAYDLAGTAVSTLSLTP